MQNVRKVSKSNYLFCITLICKGALYFGGYSFNIVLTTLFKVQSSGSKPMSRAAPESHMINGE